MGLIAGQDDIISLAKGRVDMEPDFRAGACHISAMTDHATPRNRPDVRVADSTRLNWVDRFMPQWSRPVLRLSRADRPAGTWLLLLPGWQSLMLAIAAKDWRPDAVWLFIAFGLGAFLMRGAGCTWNDITDRDFDAQVARTRSRPIPAGQITVWAAAVWMVFQALLAFVILLTFNEQAIWLGVLALIPVAAYPFMKRVTWWPQVFLGIAFNWGALLGWVAFTGSLAVAPVVLYLAGIAWTLHYDTIYAHQDKEDDALIGVKSTARLFGDATGPILAVFASLAVIGAAAAAFLALEGGALLVALAGVAAYAAHLGWQLMRLDVDNADLCLNLFRQNRDSGLILLVGFFFAGLV